MQKVELLTRLQKSRTGRALLDEVEASERAESAWIEAAAELRELRAGIPARQAELEAALKEAQRGVAEAKDALRVAEQRAGKAFRDYHSELYQAERRTIALQDVLYKNAPGALLAELADLRERLLDNFDTTSDVGIKQSVDLGRRRVSYDKSAIDAHLAARAEIQAAIERVEGQILSGAE